jgi:hypothetical protein
MRSPARARWRSCTLEAGSGQVPFADHRMSAVCGRPPPGPRLPVSFGRVGRSHRRSRKLCQVVPVSDICGRPGAGRSQCPDAGAATAYQPRPPSSPVSRREPSNVLWPPAGNPSNREWLMGWSGARTGEARDVPDQAFRRRMTAIVRPMGGGGSLGQPAEKQDAQLPTCASYSPIGLETL